MNKIVVGTDLSPHSECAIAHAIDVGRRAGVEVVMVFVDVVPEQPPVVDPSSVIIFEQPGAAWSARLALDRLALGVQRKRWAGHGVELSQLVVDGHADERLAAVAAEMKADLVVVGSHGRTGIERWLVGSVAEHVVRLASQSVLVARGESSAGGYRRVVIGTDFSASAERAIEHAVPLLAPNARVELVHAWAGSWYLAEATSSTYDVVRSSFDGVLAEAAVRLSSVLREHGRSDVEVATRLVELAPAAALAEVAGFVHADLVVVGSHGRRGVRRFLLGSVAEDVVRHARCSVLVGR
jgi:nucleotide-binding universal stress UspA family protein